MILLICAAGVVIGFQLALTALTLIGLAAAIVGLRRPALGLFGIGMLCTMDAIMGPLLLSGGLLRWNTLNYWLLIVIVLSLPFLLRLSDIHTRLLQLFVLLLSLQLAISANPVLGVQTTVAAAILFGVLVYFARACHDEQSWYWLGLIDGLLGAAGGLVFYLQKDHLPYVNPNNWSYFPLTAIFSICLALPFAHKRRRGQLYLMLLAIINVAWVFLSASRGDLLIAVCCLLFLVLLMRGLSNKLVFVISALLIGLLISTQFADLQEHTLSRIDLLVNPAYSDRMRTSGRSDLILGGWYIFRDHPFGVGTGGYASSWATIDYDENLSGYRRGQAFPAHAGWIKTLAENGIVGITLLISYVLSFTIAAWRTHDRNLRLLGLLMTLIFSLAFISIEFQWGKGIWFMAAGMTTLLHREDILFHLSGSAKRTPIRNIIRPRRAAP
ncbi:MAG: O-antigen ligase family protein [Roseiflexaceae bacterium]